MNYQQIEKEARRLQYEIWHHRQNIFQTGEPPLLRMFSPDIAARVLGLEYETRERIAAVADRSSYEAGGQLDRGRGIISISARFGFETQRFTGAHEIGHFLLHEDIGGAVVHRDLPIGRDTLRERRPVREQEADYFAACFLAPRRLVVDEFERRFGPAPLHLDENVAFYLAGKQGRLLTTASTGSLDFGIAVANATWVGGDRFASMASVFGVSATAMAIRLRELELIVD